MGILSICRYGSNSFAKLTINVSRHISTRKSIVWKQVDQFNFVINKETISKLEQLSLIGYNNNCGITILKAAVTFSEHLQNIDIPQEIEPLCTPLENCNLYLREDEVKKGNNRQQILKNAAVLEEEYFVAPLQSYEKLK